MAILELSLPARVEQVRNVREIAVAAQIFHHRRSRQAGHVHIEQHQIGMALLRQFDSLQPIVRLDNIVAVREQALYQNAHGDGIVNAQDFGAIGRLIHNPYVTHVVL